MKVKYFIFCFLLTLFSVSTQAQTDTYEWAPNKAKKRAMFTAANLCNFGVGVKVEGLYNYGVGLRGEWRAGSERQLLNGIVSVELMYNNPVKNASKHHFIKYGSFSPLIGLRLNAFRLPSGSFYIEGDGIFDLNFGAVYHTLNKSVSDSLLTRNHFSTAARIGYVTDKIDIGLWAKYSLKPTFDQKYIYESKTYNYNAIGPAINERWIIGLSLTFYLRS